jgi:HAD superfamily hydrolase (TIGR01662 family)
MPRIRAVFFDLGSTLIYSKDPWPPIYEQADRALLEALGRGSVFIDPAAFSAEFGGFIRSYYENRSDDNREKTIMAVLGECLQRKGFRDVADHVMRTGLDAMYAVTQRNWYLDEDTIPTLETLHNRGYTLGLISNTSDDKNVQQLLDRDNLRPFFETIVTSAALGIRKPDTRIFKAALDQVKIDPGEAAMVGDLLDADILGANHAGMYSIWITRHVHHTQEGELTIQPQAVVPALQQIPGLLAEIENDHAHYPV